MNVASACGCVWRQISGNLAWLASTLANRSGALSHLAGALLDEQIVKAGCRDDFMRINLDADSAGLSRIHR